MDTQGPVERIVTWWLPQVRAILGQDLCSVLLTGSAALGDYQPGWSDIDVCVVLRRPPTEEEGRSLGLLHDHMKERYVVQRKDGWQSGQVIEGYYIPEALVADPQVELPCYVAGGTTRRWASCHPITPFDRLLLVEAARPLFGTALAFARPTS